MKDERKISKARVLTVVSGQRYVSSRGSDGDIYEANQHFRLMHKHLKGSNRPRGFLHKGWGSDRDVSVRWLWTEKLGYFAPEISFRPSKESLRVASMVSDALLEIVNTDKEDPEKLIERLGAFVVEYVSDQKEGCWDDYRVIRAPGDSEMMVIARAAIGED
jgi:hypothetical protein